MNLNKLERKFGKYAIPNLSLWIIVCYLIGYLLQITLPEIFNYMLLEPYEIFHHGQIWRVITWLFMPPESLGLFTIIMLFFYYSIGNSLERTWGTFRYNLFIFSGIVATIIAVIILYFVTGQIRGFGFLVSTVFINQSILLAYAATFPNMQILLYFVIPIKIKWLGYAYVAIVVYQFLGAGYIQKVIIVASLLNVIVFFLLTRNYRRISPKEIHRKQKFKKQSLDSQKTTKHKCAVCGRTEKDGDDLVFRYCSKCDGNYEYCQDHLFTHEHVKKK
ncbi:rhomboid family protein [Anaerosacchariphilus polymeriproducens]|uniref:Peptidase S54 rhomboid domain-containing protein n=1 Tax=Anaerosacchariphilus polymeriproducens TaxID=1812858 RepID=A0A371ATM3_9FIRM|nr:hypothetical protein [Anaerosacchariphilus polymeriproducens]RDU22879.1 hypothetical protein DWV06_10905 [Anaerosacchariphilus polymeriproducens]